MGSSRRKAWTLERKRDRRRETEYFFFHFEMEQKTDPRCVDGQPSTLHPQPTYHVTESAPIIHVRQWIDGAFDGRSDIYRGHLYRLDDKLRGGSSGGSASQ